MCLSVHNSQESLLLLLYRLKCYQIYTRQKSNGSLPIVLKAKVVFTRIAPHARVLVRFYWNLQTVITSGTFTQTDQWTVMEWRWPTSSLKLWLLTFSLLPPCLCCFSSLSFILPWYTELISFFALNLYDNIMTRFRNSYVDRHTVLQLQGVKGSRCLWATGVRSDMVPA